MKTIRIISFIVALLIFVSSACGTAITPASATAKEDNPGYVSVAQPTTNIIGDISFIRHINSISESESVQAEPKKPAVAMYSVNDRLDVLDNSGNAFSTVEDILVATDYKILSAFIVDSSATVEALSEYLAEINFFDCFIVSKDPSLVKKFREILPSVSGVIDFTEEYKDTVTLTVEQCLDIRRTMKINNGVIAILPGTLCKKDIVQYLYDRQVNVWARISDTPTETEQYNAILSGAIGVISDSSNTLLRIATIKLPKDTMTRSTLNIGHRGLPSKAPENTLEGAQLAYENGANVIELDVHLTADGHVVVIHDGTTGRTCNHNISVENSTFAELRELYANKGFETNVAFAQCRIPTLEEYLAHFKDKDCLIFIEIKTGNTEIIGKVRDLVNEYGMYGNCSVITFNENIMAAMRTDWPEMSVGALCENQMGSSNPEAELRQAMDFIGKYNATLNPYHGGYGADDIRIALFRGISIYPWTFSGNIDVYKDHFMWGYSGLTGNNANVLRNMIKNTEYIGNIVDSAIVGESITPQINVTTYYRNTSIETPTIKILSGADIATVKYGAITFTGVGEVSFILSYSNIQSSRHSIFTQPITITVTAASAEPEPEPNPEQPSKNNLIPILIGVAAVVLLAGAVLIVIKKKKK